MSVAELERELIRFRNREDPGLAKPLTQETAMALRDAGNVPDEAGRTLRLFLHITSQDELFALDEKRRRWEPDYLDAPTWRRPDSKPVTVVPLRSAEVEGRPRAWWDDEVVGPLEDTWRRTGRIAGLEVPGEVRGFVLKTVVELDAAGRDVTVDAIVDSISRWLKPEEVANVERALRGANE